MGNMMERDTNTWENLKLEKLFMEELSQKHVINWIGFKVYTFLFLLFFRLTQGIQVS